MLHTHFFTLSVFYLYYVKRKNNRVFCENSAENKKFITITNFIVTLPILFDIFIILSNSKNIVLNINIMFMTFIMVSILQMNVFYEMSHFAFHILLMVQTYLFTSCNMQRIEKKV